MARTIVHTSDNKVLFGSQDHLKLSQEKSFASLIFELLSEKQPSDGQLKVFELILNISIDHGPDTPSAVETINVAKEGKTISESVAAGILQINDVHGGAQEKLMEILIRIKGPAEGEARQRRQQLSLKVFIEQALKKGDKIPGFGHRLYKDQDPRAELILDEIDKQGLTDEFVNMAKTLERELEVRSGKHLPLNVDGAIAVALCSFGWDPKLGKAVFIIARVPGLCGQFLNAKI